MGRILRTRHQKTDYGKLNNPYKGYQFTSLTARSGVKKITVHSGIKGRARSAPPITSWPIHGMHRDVDYIADIDEELTWDLSINGRMKLPFSYLDIKSATRWQGLTQAVDGLSGDKEAQEHFDAIKDKLRTANSDRPITECVGEAAAAAYMLAERKGFKMIWGFHVHSGTGIDQIWRKEATKGVYTYLVVEAKGPGATVKDGTFLPPDYGQMEFGWVMNHLYSMNQNGHAAGQEIVANLKLDFVNAYPNYGGASKSYYGLSPRSQHGQSKCTLHGIVVTAQWLSDGRLGYQTSGKTQYLP